MTSVVKELHALATVRAGTWGDDVHGSPGEWEDDPEDDHRGDQRVGEAAGYEADQKASQPTGSHVPQRFVSNHGESIVTVWLAPVPLVISESNSPLGSESFAQ